jgi:Protein of unknown function (DUF3551)
MAWKAIMKLSHLVLAASFAMSASSGAGAQNYPWCSNFADGAGTNCGFTTREQCMIAVQGGGGYCDRNTQFKPSAAAAPVPRTTPKKPPS